MLLLVVLTACVSAGLLFYFQWRGGDLGNGRSLQPRDIYLQTYLATHADELEQPAGNGFTPAPFTIAPGESADAIAANLAAAGLLNDSELFLNYLRFPALPGILIGIATPQQYGSQTENHQRDNQ